MTNNDYKVKIAVNKSLLKEFQVDSQRTVYMKDGSEFQIQIFNPYTYTIGVLISINDEEMPNILVLKPGQRIWLERYLNDTRKFLFETYEVNDSKSVRNAISKNGEIKIQFYKEKNNNNTVFINQYNYDWHSYNYESSNGIFNSSYDPVNINYCKFGSSITTSDCGQNITPLSSSTVVSDQNSKINFNKSIETGRVKKGSYSNQSFTKAYCDFECWPFNTEIIKILPESRKPIYSNDLKKIYCTNCGRKLNQKFKFCPYCGTKQ